MPGAQSTRLARGSPRPGRALAPGRVLTAPERLALFLAALHPDSTLDLLEGLAPCVRDRARAFATEAAGLSSGARQAVLTRAFGRRAEGTDRLKALLVEASPALRRAIAAVMPTPHHGLVAHLQPATDAPPAMMALAARLVREALRAA